VKSYIWSIALYGAETWPLRKLDQKYLESFEMWCWRMMKKISWTDGVNNEAVLHRVKKERNILHTLRRMKANWIVHILRRNCLLSHIIEGKIIGTRRRGNRRKQLLNDPEGSKKTLEVEGGSSGLHSLENSVWKRLWTLTDREKGGLCPQLKRQGMKLAHSPPSRTEGNNPWSYISSAPFVFIAFCLIEHRHTFTFLPFFPPRVIASMKHKIPFMLPSFGFESAKDRGI
jgi:hypothetical protein